MVLTNNYRLGFVLMLASVMLDAVSSLWIKWVVDVVDPLTFFFWRALLSAVFLIPFTVAKQGVRLPDMKLQYPLLVILSSVCLAVCVITFNFSLRHIAVGAAYAINQSAPLIVAALSVFLLRDRISGTHWLAVIAGMAGTLLIIKPWDVDFNIWSFWLLLATGLYAVYLTLNSWLAARMNTAVLIIYTTLVGLVLTLPFALVDIDRITLWQWLSIAGLAVCSLCVRYACVYAFKHAPASYLTPLEYLSVPATILGGWLVYDQQVGWIFFVGAAITIGAGLYIFYTPHHVTRGAKAVFDKSQDS